MLAYEQCISGVFYLIWWIKDQDKNWLSNLQCLWNAQNRKVRHSWLLDLEVPISEHPSKRAVTQIIFQKRFYLCDHSFRWMFWDGNFLVSTQKSETFTLNCSKTFKLKYKVENSFLKLFWKETVRRAWYQRQQEWQWILVKLRLNTYNCTHSTLPMIFYWTFPARFLLSDQAFVNINPEGLSFY